MSANPASFTSKALRATLLTGGNNVFAGTDSNTLTLTDLRMIAVVQAVASLPTSCDIKIFGMLQADMNSLTILFYKGAILNQSLILEANANDGNGWHQVFSGTTFEAQPVYSAMPDVHFHIQANFGYYKQIAPVPASSYSGSTDVATIVQTLAGNMGYQFQNNGVTAQLHNPYYPGTYFDQLNRVCGDADVRYYIIGNTIYISPSDVPLAGAPQIVLNAQSGLVGYPSFQWYGIDVQSLYNPAIQAGYALTVQSDIPGANGQWKPFSVKNLLDSLNPTGAWFSAMQCTAVPT